MKHRIIPAIMSGGAGTRLWPTSTDAQPKQFHALTEARSLFAETVARVSGETDALSFAKPIVLCASRHKSWVEAQLTEIDASPSAIVYEPVARNTAAVAAVAAALSAEIDSDALVLLLPADHIIADREGFHATLARAAPLARERIVTLGIDPTRPETGYGYIKNGAALSDGVFAIDSFREKPKREIAEQYLAEGGYSWNAGIFFFHPRTMLEEFFANADIRDHALAALAAAHRNGREIHLDSEHFARARSMPFDIAVMEHTSKGAVAPCAVGWADVGAWDEIWRLATKDGRGNATHGEVVVLDGSNNLLRGEGVKVCVSGLNDLIVIATPEAVIVVPRDRAQDVKQLRELALKPR
jgi:mannose-1-phosphate guanylyltransferase/mannose-6-phosphate isomerase